MRTSTTMELQQSLRPITTSLAIGGVYFTPQGANTATAPPPKRRGVFQLFDVVKDGSMVYCAVVLVCLWINLIRFLVSFQDGISELLVSRLTYGLWFFQCALNSSVLFSACHDPTQLREFFAVWKTFEDNSRALLCGAETSATSETTGCRGSEKFSSSTKSPAYNSSPSASPGWSVMNVFKRVFFTCCSQKGTDDGRCHKNEGKSLVSLVLAWFFVVINGTACIVLIFGQLEQSSYMSYTTTAPLPNNLITQSVVSFTIVFSSIAWIMPVAFLWSLCSHFCSSFSRLEQAVQAACLPYGRYPERETGKCPEGETGRCPGGETGRCPEGGTAETLQNGHARNKTGSQDKNSDVEIQDVNEFEEMDTIEKNHSTQTELRPDNSRQQGRKIVTSVACGFLVKPTELYANDGYADPSKATIPGHETLEKRSSQFYNTTKRDFLKTRLHGARPAQTQVQAQAPPLKGSRPSPLLPGTYSDASRRLPVATSKGKDRHDTTQKQPTPEEVSQLKVQPGEKVHQMKCLTVDEVRKFPAHLECLRRLHIQLCTGLVILDRTVSRLLMVIYATCIPLLCFLVYRMVNDKQLDAFTLSVMAYWCAGNTYSWISSSIACAKVHEAAHSPLEHLYHLDISMATQAQRDQLQLFLSKLCGPPIGFTALTIVTVTKEMLLTLGGLLVTYFFLLLQFNI